MVQENRVRAVRNTDVKYDFCWFTLVFPKRGCFNANVVRNEISILFVAAPNFSVTVEMYQEA